MVVLLANVFRPSADAIAEENAATANDTAAPISGPRDLLRRYGIGESHLGKLTDGEPIRGDEAETLLKVMFRIHSFRSVDVEHWAHDGPNLAELAVKPAASRGEIFRLDGRVTLVEVRRPAPEVGDRFELRQYYRGEFLLADGQPAVVFTQHVPRQWSRGGTVDARAGALGLFLKLGAGDADHPMPIFVARRIAWYPHTPLGDLGMDVGLLDDVQDRKPITARQRECFYQMLAAVGRAKPGQLLREANRLLADAPKELRRPDGKEFSVAPLFNQPQRQRGRLAVLSGTARQVQRILVSDPEIAARFGIDDYYQVSMFTTDSQGNPLTFCVRQLPEGMPTGSDPQYAERVRIAGFFMKSWAYRVEDPAVLDTRSVRGPRRQLAPLLFGREPVWYPQPPPSRNTVAGAIAGMLFALAVLGIWLALWRHARRERRLRDRTIAKVPSIGIGPPRSETDPQPDGPA